MDERRSVDKPFTRIVCFVELRRTSTRERDEVNISVIFPAYNEAGSLPETLDRLDAFLGDAGPASEVLVVDDGSTDGTADAVAALGRANVRALRHETNRGKGAAVRTGVLASSGDALVVTDADGNYLHNRAAPYLGAITDGAHVVLASRDHPASVWDVEPEFAGYFRRRKRMGRVFNWLTRQIVGLPFADTQTGLKVLQGDAARRLFRDLVLDGFAFDVELLCRAHRRGLRVVELPLTYLCPSDRSSITWREPARMALDLLRVRQLCRDEPGPKRLRS